MTKSLGSQQCCVFFVNGFILFFDVIVIHDVILPLARSQPLINPSVSNQLVN